MERLFFEAGEIDGAVKPLGRTRLYSGAREMSFSASGLCFRARFRKLVLYFDDYEAPLPVHVGLTVDGATTRYLLGGKRPVIHIDNLGDGEHEVSLLRLSEGDVPLYLRKLALWGEKPGFGARPEDAPLKLLFVGDSLTCGYGTDSFSTDDHEFVTWEEDVTHGYSYRTAQALGADFQIVSYSGQGIVKNCNGDLGVRFHDFWNAPARYATGEREETGFSPDCVIINGGTNDCFGNVSDTDFERGVYGFLAEVRAKYPKTPIVWFFGLMGATRMGDTAERVIAELSKRDPAVAFRRATSLCDSPSDLGCNGHPTERGHGVPLSELVPFLKRYLKL